MRECLVQLLGAEFDVVAVVENGRQAVDAAVQCLPDIAVLDISMPVMDGLDALCGFVGLTLVSLWCFSRLTKTKTF